MIGALSWATGGLGPATYFLVIRAEHVSFEAILDFGCLILSMSAWHEMKDEGKAGE